MIKLKKKISDFIIEACGWEIKEFDKTFYEKNK